MTSAAHKIAPPQPHALEHQSLWDEFWRNRERFEIQERLIRAYMPLARKVLARLMIRLPSHVRAEDLLNSALLGLHEAITRFDPATSANFEAFATRRIRGAVLDELRAIDPLTRTQRDLLAQIEQTICDWAAAHNEFPEFNEIAEAMDMKSDDLAALVDAAQPWLSLEAPISINGRAVMLGDALADSDRSRPDRETENRDVRALLRKAFRMLEAKEQKILYLYYFEELTLREIAAVFDLTEARICQIHGLAVEKLRIALSRMDLGAGTGRPLKTKSHGGRH